MKHRSRLSVKLGVSAVAVLAVGAAAATPTSVAVADELAQPTAALSGETLVVHGTHDADAITIGVGADPTTFVVSFGGSAPAQVFDRTAFHAIDVFLSGGDDTFAVDPLGQFSDAALTVFGGQGDDNIGGSRGADVIYGGEGDDTIRSNDGNDLIISGSGDDNVDGQRGTDTEDLGAGADTAVWLPGEGNDVVDGSGGHDRLDFVGSGQSEAFALTASGSGDLFTRDLGGIRMDLDRVEELDLSALGGSDTVTVGDLSATDLRTADLDLSVAGAPDGARDVVSIDGTDQPDHVDVTGDGSSVDVAGLHAGIHISGNDVRDELHVNTGAGNDVVAASDAAAAQIGLIVDLGADQH